VADDLTARHPGRRKGPHLHWRLAFTTASHPRTVGPIPACCCGRASVAEVRGPVQPPARPHAIVIISSTADHRVDRESLELGSHYPP
jgi:hypothetical protein